MEIPELFIGVLILNFLAPLVVSTWIYQKYKKFNQKTFFWIAAACMTSALSYCAQIPITFDLISANQTYDLSIGMIQILSQVCWTMVGIYLLTQIIKEDEKDSNFHSKRQSFFKIIKFAVISSITFCIIWFLSILLSFFISLPKLPYPLIQLVVNTITLLLLEQFWTNSDDTNRWQSKFIVIAATIWALLNILYHSQKSLLVSWSWDFELARMLLNILILPFLILGIERINNNKFRLKVSHQFAVRTTSLLLVGIYLLLTAAGGFYIQKFNVEWMQFFQVTFILCASLTLLFLIASAKIRSKLNFFISKNLISEKYDYRNLWLNLSDRLSRANSSILAEEAIQAFLDLVESDNGYLWRFQNDQYKLITSVTQTKFQNYDIVFLKDEFIIQELLLEKVIITRSKNNLFEYQTQFHQDKRINELEIWIFVPLMIRKDLIGIIGIGKPKFLKNIDQEDQNLLISFGRQIATIIFQQEAIEKLSDHEKFKAVSQFSAFLVHDLKTITAQLQLLVNNAERHKNNPNFFEDMVSTVSHSTHKMDRILKSLRSLNHPDTSSISPEIIEVSFDPIKIIKEAIIETSKNNPKPILKTAPNVTLFLKSNPENFKMALIHIIQNAKDATNNHDFIEIYINHSSNRLVISVIDFGVGMTCDFIKNNLFRPFVSTKGITGMGIGAFQSKEIIESMGGNISVHSQENKGSTFTISLPVFAENP